MSKALDKNVDKFYLECMFEDGTCDEVEEDKKRLCEWSKEAKYLSTFLYLGTTDRYVMITSFDPIKYTITHPTYDFSEWVPFTYSNLLETKVKPMRWFLLKSPDGEEEVFISL